MALATSSQIRRCTRHPFSRLYRKKSALISIGLFHMIWQRVMFVTASLALMAPIVRSTSMSAKEILVCMENVLIWSTSISVNVIPAMKGKIARLKSMNANGTNLVNMGLALMARMTTRANVKICGVEKIALWPCKAASNSSVWIKASARPIWSEKQITEPIVLVHLDSTDNVVRAGPPSPSRKIHTSEFHQDVQMAMNSIWDSGLLWQMV